MAVPVDGLPSLIHTGLSLCVVPPRLKGPRWRKVVAVKPGEHGDQIKLSGIDGLGDSEPLRGRYLLADAKDLPEGFDLHDVSVEAPRHRSQSGGSGNHQRDLHRSCQRCLGRGD